jgi:hypothetical protein
MPLPEVTATTIVEGESDASSASEEDSFQANKKTDEVTVPPPAPSGGYLWRFSTGLVSTTTGALTGAVGLGVGGVKWVAGKGYDAGAAVVGTTKAVVSKVPVPTLKKKPKKE